MTLELEFAARKELIDLLGELCPALLEGINEDTNMHRNGFILFLFNYPTGVTAYQTSINGDDAVALMRHWIAEYERQKALELH